MEQETVWQTFVLPAAMASQDLMRHYATNGRVFGPHSSHHGLMRYQLTSHPPIEPPMYPVDSCFSRNSRWTGSMVRLLSNVLMDCRKEQCLTSKRCIHKRIMSISHCAIDRQCGLSGNPKSSGLLRKLQFALSSAKMNWLFCEV